MQECELTNIAGLTLELHLPREWLIAEANAGRIPCLRVGRRRLFNLAAVRAAIAEQAAGSYQDPKMCSG